MLSSIDTLIAFVVILLLVSLLITVAVQIVSSLLNLRGTQLAKGLTITLNSIAPDLKNQGRALAEHILTSPMLSDNVSGRSHLWRLATAVRPDEVFDTLRRLAISDKDVTVQLEGETQPVSLRAAALKLFEGLKVDAPTLRGVKASDQEVKAALDELHTAINSLPAGDPRRQQFEDGLQEALAKLGRTADEVEARVKKAATEIDAAFKRFEFLFEMTQDRVQEWFASNTRHITMVLAFLAAIVLQLDAVEIFRLVSTNSTVRDKLVAQASQITREADKVFADSSTVLQESLTIWRKQKAAQIEEEPPAVKSALDALTVGPLESRSEVVKKMTAALETPATAAAPAKPGPDKSEMLASFNKTVDDTALDRLGHEKDEFKDAQTKLNETGFDLVPSYMTGGRWKGPWYQQLGSHFAGVLFAAALLSLGAPFWYNSLKSLMSLRSAVANNISDERDDEPPPSGKPGGTAPPTITP